MNTNYVHKIIAVFMVMTLLSCSKHEREDSKSTMDYENRISMDSTAASSSPSDAATSSQRLSSSAAVENNKDTLRKFIRTADLKFKVKNVINATYEIEDITRRFGGFVSYTSLSSTTQYQNTIRISKDTSIQSTHFTVENTITMRVPNTRLDSTLKAIAPLVEYMDYRTIKADDIGLQILSNKLSQKRISDHEKRMKKAIDHKGQYLDETISAEDNLFYKKEASDNAMISNLSLMDQVSYSTVNIYLYQDQEVKKVKVTKEQEIEPYEPAFGLKLLNSLKTGWKIIEAIVVFLVQLWALILAGVVIFMIYRKIKK
ncbi:MAG: DUF4349 domain-containing protein [Cytophagaceae bacterium]